MWSKLSNALKQRSQDSETEENTPNETAVRVSYDPQAGTRSNSVFKRSLSKTSSKGDAESNSAKLGISLPKKVKSIALDSNFSSSQLSLTHHQPSSDPTRPPYDSPRPPTDAFWPSTSLSMRAPQTPTFDSKYATINAPLGSGSVRSILRDPKTPGSGQNVRFFSKDAFKVMTPDASMATTDPEDQHTMDKEMGFMDASDKEAPFMVRLQQVSPDPPKLNLKKRPSVADVFDGLRHPVSKESSMSSLSESPSGLAGSSTPPFIRSPVFTPMEKLIPKPDISNFFHASGEPELPPIPAGESIPLLDSAVEMHDGDVSEERAAAAQFSTPPKDIGNFEDVFCSQDRSMERSNNFSFGQRVFHSLMKPSSSTPSPTGEGTQETKRASKESLDTADSSSLPPTPVDPLPGSDSLSKRSKHRGRALSDTMFQAMLRAGNPEADINDESTNNVVLYASPEPDPFSTHAATYYTPQTMIVTPPQLVKEKHVRTASAEEDVIWRLRTQLALQQELCSQYEIDLEARDELVESLSLKLSSTEKTEEKRRQTLRSWKKKVAELEKSLRTLEGEVERSRDMSVERSVMDEASSEALRMLHRRIGQLEREKAEFERREKDLAFELQDLKGTLKGREESEMELREGIRDAQDQMEMMNISQDGGDWRATTLMRKENDEERERHRLVELEWENERARWTIKENELEKERDELRSKVEMMLAKDAHFDVLKSELEAQWKHTEQATEKIATLQQERDDGYREAASEKEKANELEAQLATSEERRNELEDQVQEVWDRIEELERKRTELEELLQAERQRSAQFSETLEEREERLTEIDRERRYALDNTSRLEETIAHHDADIANYSQRLADSEVQVASLQEQIAKLHRDHSRLTDAKLRELQDAASREGEAKEHRQILFKEKADLNAELDSLKKHSTTLEGDIERLKRHVHELQQESADKEVKIVHLTKSRSQHQEDLEGLNIALDSKQQELELLKRRLGVRGTGGSTPAQPSKVAHRRDSSVFSTPSLQRPPSVTETENKLSIRAPTPSSMSITALGRSSRVNIAAPTTGTMGPPVFKTRSSIVETPTPTAVKRVPSTSLARSAIKSTGVLSNSSSTRRISTTPDPKLKRSAAKVSATADLSNEWEDKENVASPDTSLKRRNTLLAPA